MKLKILPPTLRIKNRYLTLDIKSEGKLSKNDLVSVLWNGCLRLYGESETSAFNLWLMRLYDINSINNNLAKNEWNDKGYDDHRNDKSVTNRPYYHYKAVLRCQRGYEYKVRGSLAMLSNHNSKKVNISTIGVSGTISSSIENFIN